MDRMRSYASKMQMPLTISDAKIKTEIDRTVKAHPKNEEEFYIRWIITRGGGPIEMKFNGKESNSFVIIVKPLKKKETRYLDNGQRLLITSIRRNSVKSTDPGIKSGNYLNNVLALNEANQNGYDDCIMLNEDEYVSEMSRANIWFIINGIAVTPGQYNLKNNEKEYHKINTWKNRIQTKGYSL